MKATYNITNNRLFFYPETKERLTPEQDKERRSCAFQWWPRGCFTAIWSPGAEDWIRSMGAEIEEDDTPDDVESRVERFGKYATNAEASAESAAERAMNATTARRAKLAENRAMNEAERAEYWTRRIAGAISRAQRHDNPQTCANRVKGLEADLRKHEREMNPQPYPRQIGQGDDLWVDTGSGHGHWISPENIPAHVAYHARWVEHLKMLLEYERAYLDAVGGTELLTPEKKPRRVSKAPDDGIKKGDTVKYHDGYWGQGKEHTGVVISTGPHNLRVTRAPEDDPYGYYRQGCQVPRKFCTKVNA